MKHKWIQALMVVLALAVAFPSAATIITGADGPLAPVTDSTLPFRAGGIFDFSSIDIGAGITLRFDAGMNDVTLLSLGDILIAGVIDAMGINSLTLETPGNIIFPGSFNGLILSSGQGSSSGTTSGVSLCTRTYGCPSLLLALGTPDLTPPSIPLPPGAGTITLAVPEPGTLWLMLLPMLALVRRKRT